MLFNDTYLTIGKPGEALFKSKGSKFYGYALCVNNEQDIKTYLQQLKHNWPDATHHCYAWRLGAAKTAFRVNDDGEPAGSAGRPIFKYIQNRDLTNVLIVVVRYFGGSLLGIPGLIEAYGETARLALEACEITEKTVDDIYRINLPFGYENDAYRLIKQCRATVIQQQSAEDIDIDIRLPQSQTSQLLQQATELHQLKLTYLRTE